MGEQEQAPRLTDRLVARDSFVVLIEDPEGKPPVTAHLEHAFEPASEAEKLSVKKMSVSPAQSFGQGFLLLPRWHFRVPLLLGALVGRV